MFQQNLWRNVTRTKISGLLMQDIGKSEAKKECDCCADFCWTEVHDAYRSHARLIDYLSENEPRWRWMLRKANKIKKRLDCKPGLQNVIMFKPKGMHQTTFDRLWRQVYMLENMAVGQISEKFNYN